MRLMNPFIGWCITAKDEVEALFHPAVPRVGVPFEDKGVCTKVTAETLDKITWFISAEFKTIPPRDGITEMIAIYGRQ